MHAGANLLARYTLVALATLVGCASREGPRPPLAETVTAPDATTATDAPDASVADAALDPSADAMAPSALVDATDAATAREDAARAGAASLRLVTVPTPKPVTPRATHAGPRKVVAPTVYQGELRASAGLPGQIIVRILAANLTRMTRAFSQELRNAPSTEPRVTVRFVIDGRGEVAVADVMSSNASKAMSEEVRRVVAELSFPAPDKPLVVVEATFLVVDNR